MLKTQLLVYLSLITNLSHVKMFLSQESKKNNYKPRDEEAKCSLTAIILSAFPLLYFYTFLYYTDPGSTFLGPAHVLLQYQQLALCGSCKWVCGHHIPTDKYCVGCIHSRISSHKNIGTNDSREISKFWLHNLSLCRPSVSYIREI